MIRTIALCALLFATPAAAQDLPALFDVTGVAAGDVLNIRAEPSARAPVIGTLAPDAREVEVVGQSGTWAVVNTGEGTGYASMTYLRRAAGPGWAALERPLSCFGTEPFWALEVDPVAGSVSFDLFQDPAEVMAIRTIWDTVPQSPLVAIGAEGATVVMRPETCSDGMSDFTYGIAVDVLMDTLVAGERAGRYSGCCSLIGR